MTDTLDHDTGPTPDQPEAVAGPPVLDRPDGPAVPPSPGMSREERAALLTEQRRRHRIIGAVVLAVVVLLAAGGGYVVWFTSLLGLKTVEVVAADGTLDPTLQSAVDGVVGVDPGTPLIRVDLAAIRDRVEALPGVDDATVGRHWPGTVQVTVTPRVPVAVVAANAALYLMDASGLPYETVAAKPAGLVSLRLATPGPGDPATTAGLTVIQALPAVVVAQLASVTAASAYDITLQLTDGRTVVWGDTTDNARKAQILPAVLGLPGTTFDISDPGFVQTRR